VDTKTGKVINEFGATRFDVAVRALRGELDPAPWVEVCFASLAHAFYNSMTMSAHDIIGAPPCLRVT